MLSIVLTERTLAFDLGLHSQDFGQHFPSLVNNILCIIEMRQGEMEY